MSRAWFGRLTVLTVLLGFVVVVIGAYVRLSDAGLGCPDWPGCYGQVAVPATTQDVARAQQAFPERPLEPAKAWKEMLHRYLAGSLGVLILVLALWATGLRRRTPGVPAGLAWVLVGLVVFQAWLGMLTVTLLLKPLIVMGHLLGGMSVLALLWWLYLRQREPGPGALFGQGDDRRFRGAAMLALVVLVLQIALGGWTSSNYAALSCPDFPACNAGQWWPPMDFGEAFVLWRGLGANYEFGVLEHPARTAIHMTHRIGAVVTLLVLAWAGLRMALGARTTALRYSAIALLILLLLQLLLGVANVVLGLPLLVAAAHNGGAALLLLALVTVNHWVRPRTAMGRTEF